MNKNLLTKEKFPYLFILITGIFIWSLSNLMENSKNSPIVEYKLKQKSSKKFILILNNLSYENRFKGIEFSICNKKTDFIPDLDTITSAFIKPIPPAYQSRKIVSKDNMQNRCLNFTIEDFQPNNSFHVIVTNNGTFDPYLSLRDSNDQIVRLIKSSTLTWMLKNQVIINITGLFLSFVLLIFYYLFLKKHWI